MKKQIATLIKSLLGQVETAGTPVNLEYGGGPLLQSSVIPDNQPAFNEFWQRVSKLNNQTTP